VAVLDERDDLKVLAEQMPCQVGNFRVKSVVVRPTPALPDGRRGLCALVVSDEEDDDLEECRVLWFPPPGTAAQQAISQLQDSFGVLGVWPAAWVAAECVLKLCLEAKEEGRPPLRILEIGCGSGLPSLCALATGASVVATDLEELPLALLKAAAISQDLPGQLETLRVDALSAVGSGFGRAYCPSETQQFDVIVCSDCLYKVDVAQAIGKILARALSKHPGTKLVVTDAYRRGRDAFLDTLTIDLGLLHSGSLPGFESVAVPPWAVDEARDPFNGSATEEVGLLRLR